MTKRSDPEMIDDDNPEWTDEMFAKAVRFSELPKDHQKTLRGVGRPKKSDAKVLISLHVFGTLTAEF